MSIHDVYIFSLLTGTANKTDSTICDAVISKELGGKPKRPRKDEWKQLEQTRRTNKAICEVEDKMYLFFPQARLRRNWVSKEKSKALRIHNLIITSYNNWRGFCKQYIWQWHLMSLMPREKCKEWQAYLWFRLSFPYPMFSLLTWPVDETFQVADILYFLCL